MLKVILDRLDKVKTVGNETWACCPVHKENNPSMSLREADGKIIAHCFACHATGVEIVEALGLPASVLFSENTKSYRRSIPNKVIEKAKEDAYFIEIFDNEKSKGGRITWNDQKRYKLALQRVKLLEQNDI